MVPSLNSPPEIEHEQPAEAELRSPGQMRTPAPARYGILSRLRSYLVFDPLIWIYTVVLGIVSIPFGLFDHNGRILHRFARFWSQLIMKTICSPVSVTGMEQIDTSKPHVYAVNHASALDIPVLYVYLPFQFRIVFKKELLSYPVIGWHLKRSGQICIDQQKPAASIGSIRAGTRVQVLEVREGWRRVEDAEGRQGWTGPYCWR